MFILYGTRKKVKVIKPLRTDKCVNCNHVTEKSLAREKCSVTIFFIPVFTWTTAKFELCPVCGKSKMLSSAEFKELKKNN